MRTVFSSQDFLFYHHCRANSFDAHELFYLKISKITGCELQRIGDLNFDLRTGTCVNFHAPEEKIFLCFAQDYADQCRR